MNMGSHTTPEGITLRAFSSLYVDYGLEITSSAGEELYYSPSCLSNDSYGHKPAARFEGDHDAAEEAESEGETECFVDWTVFDWAETLRDEADTLIEAFVGEI